MDIVKLPLSLQLKVIRAAKGYSQAELAKEIGISTPTLSRYEGGDKPSSDIIWRSIDEVVEKLEQEAMDGVLNEQEKEKTKKKREKKLKN